VITCPVAAVIAQVDWLKMILKVHRLHFEGGQIYNPVRFSADCLHQKLLKLVLLTDVFKRKRVTF